MFRLMIVLDDCGLRLSPNIINAYFPSIETFSQSFKVLGIFILILIVLWNLLKNIFGETSLTNKDHPVLLLLRLALALVLILYSMSLMSYLFKAFSTPFYTLTINDSTEKAFALTSNNNIFVESLNTAFSNFLKSASDSGEDGYTKILSFISDWIFSEIAILKSLIEIICIGLVGYKLITFLLEILQRYLILMLQAYLSPLVWGTIVSGSTIEIFKKWCEILFSNFCLMYLDSWMLGLILRSMAYMFSPRVIA